EQRDGYVPGSSIGSPSMHAEARCRRSNQQRLREHELAKRQLNRPQDLRFLSGLVVTTAMEWRSHRRRANNPGRGERPERSSATTPLMLISSQAQSISGNSHARVWI